MKKEKVYKRKICLVKTSYWTGTPIIKAWSKVNIENTYGKFKALPDS